MSAQSNYDLVIFDFDGTLADSFTWFVTIYDDLAARFNLPSLDRSQLHQLRHFNVHHISREYNIPLWKIIQIGNHLKRKMAGQIDQIKLMEGMQSVLDHLWAAGIRMAVVSSNAEGNVRKVLGAQNAAHFEWFECGVSMFGKLAKFEKVLAKTGVTALRTLCIGDEERDLKSSHQAGIAFGAVSWGYTSPEIFKTLKPDAIFSHPLGILDYIQNGKSNR